MPSRVAQVRRILAGMSDELPQRVNDPPGGPQRPRVPRFSRLIASAGSDGQRGHNGPAMLGVSAGLHLAVVAGVVMAVPRPQPEPDPVLLAVSYIDIARPEEPPPDLLDPAPDPPPSEPPPEVEQPEPVPTPERAPQVVIPEPTTQITTIRDAPDREPPSVVSSVPADSVPTRAAVSPAAEPRRPPPEPSEPTFVAATVEQLPELLNRRRLGRLLKSLYPTELRELGVSGQVIVRFVIGVDGEVEPASVNIISSSHPAFEQAARRALGEFRFRPAAIKGEPVRMLTQLPINWSGSEDRQDLELPLEVVP